MFSPTSIDSSNRMMKMLLRKSRDMAMEVNIHFHQEKSRDDQMLRSIIEKVPSIYFLRTPHLYEYSTSSGTPLGIVETEETQSDDTIPEKSKKKYTSTYTSFMEWRSQNNVDSFSEKTLLDYFSTLAKTYKSSTLWTHYSMLKTTLIAKNNINIEYYCKLRAFLKSKSQGYHAKKARIFTSGEINKFISEAPDIVYLATKVALIMGIIGGCRANELHAMNIGDVQDLGSALLITIPNTKSKVVRKFTLTDNFYQICKMYIDLRPAHAAVTSFFLHYQKGKCNIQRIGINKFGTMGKEIAKFLKLPNPELYTGHCFRRSSATLGVNAGGDITALKRQGCWRSTSMTESVEDSITNRMNVSSENTQQSGEQQRTINDIFMPPSTNIYIKDENDTSFDINETDSSR